MRLPFYGLPMVILVQEAASYCMVIFALAAGREPAGITTLPKKGSGIDLRGLLLLHNIIR